MKNFVLTICLLLAFGLTACSGDETVENTQSPEAQEMTEQVGGPFTPDEYEKFLIDLPEIKSLVAKNIGDGVTDNAALSAKVLSEVKGLGWNEDRFMYIYSHAVSVANVKMMEDMSAEMSAQLQNMPDDQKKIMEQAMAEQMGGQMDAIKAQVDAEVPSSEQIIIRNNMSELFTALGIGQ